MLTNYPTFKLHTEINYTNYTAHTWMDLSLRSRTDNEFPNINETVCQVKFAWTAAKLMAYNHEVIFEQLRRRSLLEARRQSIMFILKYCWHTNHLQQAFAWVGHGRILEKVRLTGPTSTNELLSVFWTIFTLEITIFRCLRQKKTWLVLSVRTIFQTMP